MEMRDARALRPKFSSDPRFQIRECTVPQWRFNRFLYEAVGAEWQWNDKLVWSDESSVMVKRIVTVLPLYAVRACETWV
jgi:hypothetical protein